MPVIIEKLLTKPKVYSGFEQNEKFYQNIKRKRFINVRNFFPAVVIMVILRILYVPSIYVALAALIVYAYTTYTNIIENNKKIDFLDSIMFNDNVEPFEIESYLEYDQKLIDFYYKNKWYADFNLTAYRKSLEATNNLLRYTYNLSQNLMKQPEQLYRNAYEEYKEALNNLHSSIYKIVSHSVEDDIFNDNLTTLQALLRKHIVDIQKNVIKCGYNLYDINIWSIINPTNIECEDDTKTKNYSPNYSFF